jgi:SAM-dependent methyltransferase
MSADAATLAVYAAHGLAYADRIRADAPDAALSAFMALLPAGASVLDLGCGPGQDSAFLTAAGFRPDPVDASAEMVALARSRHGLDARLGDFDGLTAEDAYDGIWANFSLLHAARADLPRHLGACVRALRPGGLLHVAMKTGRGERRDGFGRFYAYITADELRGLVEAAGAQVVHVEEGAGSGLSDSIEPFVVIRARKSDTP